MKEEKPTLPVRFNLNGKAIDLTEHLPLTIGDIKRLKAEGLDVTQISEDNVDIDQLVKILTFICKKGDSSVTEEDVEAMPLPLMNRLSERVFKGDDFDLPF